MVHKIQNSPNNSPIRRSSSFSTKNQMNTKNTNIQRESNLRNSPHFTRNSPIQRSASTANMKPDPYRARRSSTSGEHRIDRGQFGDTESSSEEDALQKRASITNTKCNRAFALRRARADAEPPRCPGTPEMRRKFQPERAVSVDRKAAEVQSRYLLNLSRKVGASPKAEAPKNVPKAGGKPQAFARTDSGRFSMRASPKPASSVPKHLKKDGGYGAESGAGGFFNKN